MSVVKMSNEAYTEFKSFLQENGVEKFDIRINLAGVAEAAQYLILFWMNNQIMMKLLKLKI